MPKKTNIYYNRTNTCDRCVEEGIETKLVSGKALKEYDKKGNWTGRWLCNKCYMKDYDRRPGCGHDIIKSLAKRRIGNLDLNSPQAKGDNFEELTCRWRSTVSIIPVENLNKKNDNFARGTPIDHSYDSVLGIPQTRGKLYDSYNRFWLFGNLEMEWDKKFNNLICYCASKDGKIIERIYIFSKEEIIGRKSITISKNCQYGWYEEYRVTDEETIKKVNEMWKDIIKKVRRMHI